MPPSTGAHRNKNSQNSRLKRELNYNPSRPNQNSRPNRRKNWGRPIIQLLRRKKVIQRPIWFVKILIEETLYRPKKILKRQRERRHHQRSRKLWLQNLSKMDPPLPTRKKNNRKMKGMRKLIQRINQYMIRRKRKKITKQSCQTTLKIITRARLRDRNWLIKSIATSLLFRSLQRLISQQNQSKI